jgi:nickel/cobalt exporter
MKGSILIARGYPFRFAKIIRGLPISLALMLTLLTAQLAWAHPPDMFFQSHTIDLTPSGIRLEWGISPGPLLAQGIWEEADQNGDGAISPEEALAWIEPRLPALTGVLDETTSLAWRVESVDWPSSFADFQVGDALIYVQLTADWPAHLAGSHRINLHNNLEETVSVDWFYVQGVEGVTFHTPSQQNGLLVADLVMPEVQAAESTTQPASGEVLHSYWESGMPALPGTSGATGRIGHEGEPTSSSPPPQTNRSTAILTGFVRAQEQSFTFYLVALPMALVLGALHALTPGHGKTIVAAYLVGSRGTVRHAVSLGLVVTLTHTGSVLALGVLTLIASQYIIPTKLFPILEIASGLLIVGLGLHLLEQRWRTWRSRTADAGHHHHDIGSHSHPHSHAHTHDHHHLPDVSAVSWRSLLALGVSGGLVPCPDAIAILLVAVTMNRITVGLTLIVAFSLGLALVLIVIGIAMVHSGRLLHNVSWLERLVPAVPLLSTVVVLGLGLGLTWSAARSFILYWSSPSPSTTASALAVAPASATQEAGGNRRQPGHAAPLASMSEPFQIERASILYLGRDEKKRSQLFLLPLAGGEPISLTHESLDVWDYALSPDEATVVYATLPLDEGGSSDLWAIDTDGSHRRLLLDCPASSCSGAVWSPDGQRLVYEKVPSTSLSGPMPLPSLWWLDLSTAETSPLFQDSSLPGVSPSWSPDGQWLSYVSPGATSIQVYNLQDGRRHSIHSRTGSSAIWHPDGESLLIIDVLTKEGQAKNHLLRFDLESAQLMDVSQKAEETGGSSIDDSWPAWSPSGEWIAVVRQDLTDSGASMGDQIWLIHPDGSQGRQLTHDVEIIHQAPVWSPDSRYILFQQYRLKKPGAQPEIYLLDTETGAIRALVTPASRPTWLP